jgi:hypothetical protein
MVRKFVQPTCLHATKAFAVLPHFAFCSIFLHLARYSTCNFHRFSTTLFFKPYSPRMFWYTPFKSNYLSSLPTQSSLAGCLSYALASAVGNIGHELMSATIPGLVEKGFHFATIDQCLGIPAYPAVAVYRARDET